MQFILISIIWILTTVFIAKPALAAKKFVPKGTIVSNSGKTGGGAIPVSVKYRADKRALNFFFTNFSGISSVSYIFSYETNGNTQGAAGSITASNSPTQSRELLFGTCSTSVCTYHTGIKNAKLTFTANYTNGKKAAKTFRIKTYF